RAFASSLRARQTRRARAPKPARLSLPAKRAPNGRVRWRVSLVDSIAGPMEASQETLDRIERERAYHNERFTEKTRQAEGKFYFAIKDGATAFSDRVSELAVGARVLEYGCGNASQARALARVAKSVDGIDISDVAIAEASEIAKAEGLTNFRFQTM